MLDISRSIGRTEGKFKDTIADRNFKEVTRFISQIPEFIQIDLDHNLIEVMLFAQHPVLWFGIKNTLLRMNFKKL